jgi:toxin ParE1/3/4
MKLRVLAEARKETERAAEWYDEQRLGLGEDFLQELESVYTNIEDHPHRPLRITIAGLEEREFHRVILRRFPYKVIYEVDDDEIVVLAVAHARRKPNYWADRL